LTKSRKAAILALVRATDGPTTEHAAENMDRLDLTWGDVIAVVASATWHHPERDEKKEARLKDSFAGRDSIGRRMYLTGKEIRRDGKAAWLVITFHEADQE
jgi:hypothetical protein